MRGCARKRPTNGALKEDEIALAQRRAVLLDDVPAERDGWGAHQGKLGIGHSGEGAHGLCQVVLAIPQLALAELFPPFPPAVLRCRECRYQVSRHNAALVEQLL